ncbi:C4-dicarboxylate-binding periplasmic protein precursor [Rhodobacteraceae bacterium THAF1]|uniref:TRAP transporter substrate-binding protein n=1 Tax=Palleronia sp. THAF1 TaxID=2587842 RepID=UPI000F3BCA1F|nr:TRAP transporter substrate-binding protein [Palleronia sp. THAF1]QFU08761.1 C4-dicarboxylate-binding periplasmic protein precursor [Palleronia sp. THAF1]VDC31246.1 C4-dicarboxylate-binding periplasmic protein precursor [Rhodobacteraceae bacterium THAF1]
MTLTHLAATTALIGALCAVPATAQETVLRYSSWFPESHSLNTALREWIGNVEEATEGRVTIEYLPATVGAVRDQFDVARDGLADITLILPGYTPGRFPLMEMGELPLLVPTDQATLAPVFNRVYEDQLAQYDPFEGTHPLTVFASAPTSIVTSSGNAVTSMEDFAGLKLRAPSTTASAVIDAVGAVAVQKPVTEIYELASTGVVDGTFFSLAPIVSWNTAEIFKEVTEMPGGMGQSVIALLMNQRKWDSLSEEDRAAISEVSGPALAQIIGRVWQQDEDEAMADLEEIGGFTFHEVSNEFFQSFETAIQPVEAEWIERAKAEGVEDPEALLEAFRDELRSASDS